MIVVRRPAPFHRDAEDSRCKSVPSPERIRELCAEIRHSWSPNERRRRAGMTRLVALLEMPLETRRKGFWGD